MDTPWLEISEVRMLYQGDGIASPRAELITRRAFEILQEMVESDMKGVSRNYTIEHLVVPPVEVSFGQSTDETIAQTTAVALFRTLLNVI